MSMCAATQSPTDLGTRAGLLYIYSHYLTGILETMLTRTLNTTKSFLAMGCRDDTTVEHSSSELS